MDIIKGNKYLVVVPEFETYKEWLISDSKLKIKKEYLDAQTVLENWRDDKTYAGNIVISTKSFIYEDFINGKFYPMRFGYVNIGHSEEDCRGQIYYRCLMSLTTETKKTIGEILE